MSSSRFVGVSVLEESAAGKGFVEAGGGGVGLLGEGTSGTGGAAPNGAGTGGSGGTNGSTGGGSGAGYAGAGASGGVHGGGAGRHGYAVQFFGFIGNCCPPPSEIQGSQPAPGRGGVRIIWPGCARSYPSTRTGNE